MIELVWSELIKHHVLDLGIDLISKHELFSIFQFSLMALYHLKRLVHAPPHYW